jgi:hypothetical protein
MWELSTPEEFDWPGGDTNYRDWIDKTEVIGNNQQGAFFRNILQARNGYPAEKTKRWDRKPVD